MTRNVVLAGVALVLFLVAGFFLLRTPAGDEPPADRFVDFHCPKCEHSFRVSERDFERLWDRREYTILKDPRAVLFKCRKCGQMTAETRGSVGAELRTPGPRPHP